MRVKKGNVLKETKGKGVSLPCPICPVTFGKIGIAIFLRRSCIFGVDVSESSVEISTRQRINEAKRKKIRGRQTVGPRVLGEGRRFR